MILSVYYLARFALFVWDVCDIQCHVLITVILCHNITKVLLCAGNLILADEDVISVIRESTVVVWEERGAKEARQALARHARQPNLKKRQ